MDDVEALVLLGKVERSPTTCEMKYAVKTSSFSRVSSDAAWGLSSSSSTTSRPIRLPSASCSCSQSWNVSRATSAAVHSLGLEGTGIQMRDVVLAWRSTSGRALSVCMGVVVPEARVDFIAEDEGGTKSRRSCAPTFYSNPSADFLASKEGRRVRARTVSLTVQLHPIPPSTYHTQPSHLEWEKWMGWILQKCPTTSGAVLDADCSRRRLGRTYALDRAAVPARRESLISFSDNMRTSRSGVVLLDEATPRRRSCAIPNHTVRRL
jgi:hypothetical protein